MASDFLGFLAGAAAGRFISESTSVSAGTAGSWSWSPSGTEAAAGRFNGVEAGVSPSSSALLAPAFGFDFPVFALAFAFFLGSLRAGVTAGTLSSVGTEELEAEGRSAGLGGLSGLGQAAGTNGPSSSSESS